MSHGEIKQLSSLFAKYKETLMAPEATVVGAFVEVVYDLMGINIEKNKIRYVPSTKTLSINADGLVRSEVRIREQEILIHMMGRLGKNNAPTKII